MVWMYFRGVFFAVVLMTLFSAWAGPTAEQVRQATAGYLERREAEAGIDKLAGYVSLRVSKSPRMSSRELMTLKTVSACIQLMEMAVPTGFDQWILGSGERLHLFVDIIDPADDRVSVVEILETLRAHDPAGVEEYFELALAIAVVMDKPVRKMHGQMGQNVLSYDPDPVERFDYFKNLYASGKSKVDYEDLSVQELIFVVHVPVPASELMWARKHVDCRLADWGENYGRIAYNHDRLSSSRFKWDQGPYTLKSINSLGGICVDQAYFCVITARAFGIPSIYFRGAGDSCNHAWFAFMEKPGEWHLGIGRYGSEYTTGFAVNPQTNRQMTDHDVEYTCERSLHSSEMTRASAYMSLVEVLYYRDSESALKCAKQARVLVKRYLSAWEAERRLLIKQEQYDELLEQFAEQKDIFRKYPYILNDSADEISTALKKAGRKDEAALVQRKLSGVVGEDQDDLAYKLEIQKIEALVSAGEMKKARREIEQMLENPEFRGNKSFGLIHKYVQITAESDQTHAAVKFLEDYIPDLTRSFQFPPLYEVRLWEMLGTAYRNNNDQEKVVEIDEKILWLKSR